jgi:sulfoxide reductase heme-binding subunit YedZ
MTGKSRSTPLRVIVHIGGWLPLVVLVVDFFAKNLTVNPIQAIEQRTGLYALTFVLIALACTPGASFFGWKELIQRRKALGNYGFMYAALHMVTFFGIDYGLDFAAVLRDVWNKWYIIIGAIAFLMLLSLAITSFTYWMKRLGKNWKRLHKLIYVIAPLVVFHFLLVVKGDITRLSGDISQPVLYGGIAAILLIVRIPPVKAALLGLRYQVEAATRGKGQVVLRPATPDETPKT